jgi:hypothetical protein
LTATTSASAAAGAVERARAIADEVIRKKTPNFVGYVYYVVCVSAHQPDDDMFVPYLDGLYDIAKRLAYEGKVGALIGIDSTVTRGTSAKIAGMLLTLPCRIPEKKHQKIHIVLDVLACGLQR